MGNKAIIKGADSPIGVYLNWNGGRDSVEAFLEYCRLRGFRGFGQDTGYAVARLTQVIANFFGGPSDIRIASSGDDPASASGLNHGIYIVYGWKIEGRVWPSGRGHAEQRVHDRHRLLKAIDLMQPELDQLGEAFWDAEVVPTSALRVGDRVFVQDALSGKYSIGTVCGFGTRHVGGADMHGVPYVDVYGKEKGCEFCQDNYLRMCEVRRVKGGDA